MSANTRGLLDPGVLYIGYAEHGGPWMFFDADGRVPSKYWLIDPRTGAVLKSGNALRTTCPSIRPVRAVDPDLCRDHTCMGEGQAGAEQHASALIFARLAGWITPGHRRFPSMAVSPGSIARAPTDGQLRLITKVARMYHERGVRQIDIAETLHLPRPGCHGCSSGRLSSASFVLWWRWRPGVHTELEEALEEKYGLAEAVIVDVDGTNEEITAALGSAGATYLETTLTGGERVGISSWSQTLLAVVDRMRPLRVRGAESVIQLIGGSERL